MADLDGSHNDLAAKAQPATYRCYASESVKVYALCFDIRASGFPGWVGDLLDMEQLAFYRAADVYYEEDGEEIGFCIRNSEPALA